MQADKMVREKDLFYILFSFKRIPVADRFVGHNTEQRRLAKLMTTSFTNNMHYIICILYRIGEVGKSQIVAEFAQKY